jgi:hypothetical protein
VNTFLVLAAGYVVGAKTRGQDLDRLTQSLKALCQTDEFADVLSATRAQLGNTLRELALVVDGQGDLPDTGDDIVAKVRHLVGPR